MTLQEELEQWKKEAALDLELIKELRAELAKMKNQRDIARQIANKFALVEWDMVTPPMPDAATLEAVYNALQEKT